MQLIYGSLSLCRFFTVPFVLFIPPPEAIQCGYQVWTYTHMLKTKEIPKRMGLKQQDGEIICL